MLQPPPLLHNISRPNTKPAEDRATKESAGHPSKDASVPSKHPGESGEAERENRCRYFRLVPGWRKPVGLRKPERPRPALHPDGSSVRGQGPVAREETPDMFDRNSGCDGKRRLCPSRDEEMDSSLHGHVKDLSKEEAPEVSSTPRVTGRSLDWGQRVHVGAESRTRAARSQFSPDPCGPRQLGRGVPPAAGAVSLRPHRRGLTALAGSRRRGSQTARTKDG